MRNSIIALIFCCSAGAAGAAVTQVDLVENAPDRYVVVQGDTLWSIAKRYLKDPWRWPELWKNNQDQLHNPHRIFPGDILVLDYSARVAQLQIVESDVVKLTPQVVGTPIAPAPVPLIPASSIAPFLAKPLVVTETELDSAARIVATEEDHLSLGAGDTAYAEGITEEKGDYWQILRRGDPLVDPDSKETLGYQAIYLGDARVTRFGDVSVLAIEKSAQEISTGDRLLPSARDTTLEDYMPHAPGAPISARIIDIYNDLFETGPYQIVVLNRGTREGLEPGNVLAIYRDLNSPSYRLREKDMKYRNEPMGDRNSPLYGRVGPTGSDSKSARQAVLPSSKLPDARYGLLMVFRVFDRASYAIIMSADRPVALYDRVTNP